MIYSNPSNHLSHALREVFDAKESRTKVESVVGGEDALVLVVLGRRCAVVDQSLLIRRT